MGTRKRVVRRRPARKARRVREAAAEGGEAGDDTPIVYIHGIGQQGDPVALKREWDLALFGREMGARTRMAYWADILHGTEPREPLRARRTERGLDLDALLDDAGVGKDEGARALAASLVDLMGVGVPETTAAAGGPRAKVLPLPGFLRKPIARAFLEALIKDCAAYFFRPGVRKRIQQRLRDPLAEAGGTAILVAHSLGSVVALEVLAELAGEPPTISDWITLGSSLGITEVQDFLSCPLDVPRGVRAWHNFADPLDPVAADKGLSNDFDPSGFIVDQLVVNTRTRQLDGFNPHSAVGYLAHPKVRFAVQRAARVDTRAPFLVARDVAADFAVEARQPVLIEILEPGNAAMGESEAELRAREAREDDGVPALARRIEHAAREIEAMVGKEHEQARVERLRRFVAAHLTPRELGAVASRHRELRVYSLWKSSVKRKLLNRSARVIQADAARTTYAAAGRGIRWAVLDTGVRHDHPHFARYRNIEAIWDCTVHGKPVLAPRDLDRDGHGSHVCGIIAGSDGAALNGIAPEAKLVVYKVLNEKGEGEDAWIIKALDHIAEQNESSARLAIHGINLSLGGPYDSTVYGCGYTPLCMELRRQWRSGVLVCVASGNEGQVEVYTPDGEVELNSQMSIGDPANLEDCVAVGSVNADHPHLYGISSFSSRGPTSDGRMKPDVVAPGERITSCDAHSKGYRSESGTSMAVPHVSGLLAAFLSVRAEFRGRPDEVKKMLLAACTDIGRDRYHQGHGIPNLMRMLLDA